MNLTATRLYSPTSPDAPTRDFGCSGIYRQGLNPGRELQAKENPPALVPSSKDARNPPKASGQETLFNIEIFN